LSDYKIDKGTEAVDSFITTKNKLFSNETILDEQFFYSISTFNHFEPVGPKENAL